jgi:hypothetical protein
VFGHSDLDTRYEVSGVVRLERERRARVRIHDGDRVRGREPPMIVPAEIDGVHASSPVDPRATPRTIGGCR